MKIIFVVALSIGLGLNVANGDYVKNFADYVEERIRQVREEAALPVDFSEYRGDEFSVPYDYGTYDFIIVGAGSTGATLANRLSENPRWNILLLEAGDYPDKFTEIPGVIDFLRFTKYNWGYKSTPQQYSCLGMVNQQCIIPRGRGVGGTTIINGLMYVRGNPIDYDLWASLGNPGWSYRDVLPIFKKTQHMVKNNPQVHIDWKYHGTDGPLHVEVYPTTDDQLNAFYEANRALGYKMVDVNSPRQIGFSPKVVTMQYGKRLDTNKVFITPIRNRRNLHVVTRAFVTKVIINRDTKGIVNRATGVVFSLNGLKYVARASKEVILSAGSINTPQLLMLSGVGPKHDLKMHGIPVIKNLPVGRTLYEHPLYLGMIFSTNFSESTKSFEGYIRDYLHGYGPLTVAGGMKAYGFYQTKIETIPNYPDLEILYSATNCTDPFMEKGYGLTRDTYKATYSHVNPSKCFALLPIALHAKSSGYVRLQSRNPYQFPAINPNHLSDYQHIDIDTLYEGIKLILKLVDTAPFKRLDAKIGFRPLKACTQHKFLSKSYWYCSLRQLTANVYHPVGTCPMGPKLSRRSVVNNDLKVHGIDRLRVADASVIPFSLSGHPNAPCIMIGDKLANILKRQYYWS